jgi:signal peptidase I
MEDPKQQPRLAWAAVALSLVATGVGHIYCGQIVKGLLLFCAWFLAIPLVVAATVIPPSTANLVLLIVTPALFLVAVYFLAAIDAYRVARRVGSMYQLRDYNRSAIYVTLIVVALVYRIGLMAGVCETSFEAFMIPSRSMSPTVVQGDRVLVNKTLGQQSLPDHGDLIAFHTPEARNAIYVKRVVGLPGDRVAMDAGELIINGRPLEHEPVSPEGITMDEPDANIFLEQHGKRRYQIQMKDVKSLGAAGREMRQMAEIVVPARSVFVLGDNRDKSKDSRSFGVVHAGDIVGILQYIHWPSRAWSRFGAVR